MSEADDEHDQDSEPTMTAPEGQRPDNKQASGDTSTPADAGSGVETEYGYDQDAEAPMTAPDADRPVSQPSNVGPDA